MAHFEQWAGFKGKEWVNSVDVRSFIQENYTPYEGDESFLEGPTEATDTLWGKLQELQKEERAKGGVLDMETEVVSGLTAYGPGYISEETKDLEKVVDIFSDKVKKFADLHTAAVFMGHGTEHSVNTVYTELEEKFRSCGIENVFVGTVEAEPELDEVILKVRAGGYKKVVLMPFMIVSGDHASNDMAGLGQDSWKNNFINEGFEVECIMKGLGEYSEIQSIFAEHVKSAE